MILIAQGGPESIGIEVFLKAYLLLPRPIRTSIPLCGACHSPRKNVKKLNPLL